MALSAQLERECICQNLGNLQSEQRTAPSISLTRRAGMGSCFSRPRLLTDRYMHVPFLRFWRNSSKPQERYMHVAVSYMHCLTVHAMPPPCLKCPKGVHLRLLACMHTAAPLLPFVMMAHALYRDALSPFTLMHCHLLPRSRKSKVTLPLLCRR